MSEIILLTISEDGEIDIETQGFKGKGCIKSTEFLKDVLGKELHRQLTPAYYEADGRQATKKYLNLCG